ncbi:hypothetical protein V1478_010415 [Vespula squamosa]|uniref:Uncharacterized protein n=1 Tax=Vespula squamosa TaxID=30214 RepID=A0ABD2AHQ1_VESSQ
MNSLNALHVHSCEYIMTSKSAVSGAMNKDRIKTTMTILSSDIAEMNFMPWKEKEEDDDDDHDDDDDSANMKIKSKVLE